MSRSFERRRASDLAATLMVVLLAVSIADIDDYDMRSQAVRSPFNSSMSLTTMVNLSPATDDAGSDSEHLCACLLCTATLSDSFGTRVLPPSAGKLSTPFVPDLVGSPLSSEVFHPPSA